MKPILHFQEKVIVPFEKIRTRKKAMKRIADMLAEDAAQMPLEAAIIHANRPEEAEIWLDGTFQHSCQTSNSPSATLAPSSARILGKARWDSVGLNEKS